jgi:hypothetical protein
MNLDKYLVRAASLLMSVRRTWEEPLWSRCSSSLPTAGPVRVWRFGRPQLGAMAD